MHTSGIGTHPLNREVEIMRHSTKIVLSVLFILALLGGSLSSYSLTSDHQGFGKISRPATMLSTSPTAQLGLSTETSDINYLPLIIKPVEVTDSTRFAVIGDYGTNNSNEARVAALVNSWNPDFVITTGDNNYPDGEAATIDKNIGQYYSQYIGNYQGTYGPGSNTNRFWPSLGNHDWHTITCTGDNCTGAYFDYFTLPGNERYYEVDLGLVHLFAIDSDSDEPNGRDEDSIQASWLQDRLAASTSCYNLVYFHHTAYSSGRHGSNSKLQWPFSDWGADAVLNGHDHLYERLDVGGTPYFVNGAGGASLYEFTNIGELPPEATSIFRYNKDHGAMLVTATTAEITYEFYNAEGVLKDHHSVASEGCQLGKKEDSSGFAR